MPRFASASEWWDAYQARPDRKDVLSTVVLHKDGSFGNPFQVRVKSHDSVSVAANNIATAEPIVYRLDPMTTHHALSARLDQDGIALLFVCDADLAEYVKAAQLRAHLRTYQDYMLERSDSLALTAAIECLRGNVARRDMRAMLAAAERDADASERAGRPSPLQVDYTVCFLFSHDLESVLLQTKSRTDFKGKLNGVGGKLEPDESPEDCARREIREETGLDELEHLAWIGTLELPDNCDNHGISPDPMAPACRLYYYAAVFDPEKLSPPAGAEKLELRSAKDVIGTPVTEPGFAGHGDLQYFVRAGRRALAARLFD